MLRKYIINGKEFDVQIVIRETNRNLCLRIKNNRIYLSMPYLVADKEIIKILERNFKIITEKLTPKKTILYIGKEYDYEIRLADYNQVLFLDKIVIYTKNDNQIYVNKLLKNAYITMAQKLIEPYLKEAHEVFKDDIKKPLSIKYRYLTTAFGKCYPKRSLITFSGICAKLEPTLIKLIVFHEFCHLRYLSHNKEFYDYLESKLTDSKVLTKKLRTLKISDFFD